MTAVSDGAIAGTSGKSKRIEALKLTLSGLDGYSVEYRVHQQTYGWSDWVTTTNGTDIADAVAAGVTGKSKRVEAVEIKVVKGDSTTTPDEPTEDLAVSSIAATSAKTVAVTFNRAPDDTSAIAATVKMNSTAKTVTSSWNDDNTILTLTSATKFSTGTYTVDVTNGDTDLSSSTVTFSEQKVAKIDITSDKVAVQYDSPSYYGYVTYKVYDQYGVDVTDTSLANSNLTISSIGTDAQHKNGLYSFTTGTTPLVNYTSVTINAYTSSGVVASKVLTVSSSYGTLSSITLGTGLVDADGEETTLSTGDSSVAYLPFTATDINGNTTTNYSYIAAGITDVISSTDVIDLQSSATTYVTAQLVTDPSDTTKAAIEVDSTTDAVSVDTPITITAMTPTGSSSQYQFTLSKPSTVTTFTISSPEDTVISGDDVVLPFTAEDQDGNEITDTTTLNNALTNKDISVNVSLQGATDPEFVRGSDGKAVLYISIEDIGDTATTCYVSSNTSTGGYSSITFTVEPSTDPDSMTINSSSFVKTMATGASQEIYLSDFTILDEYDSAYSLDSYNPDYAIFAFTSDSTKVAIDANTVTTLGNSITGAGDFYVEATGTGSATVTYVLAPNTAANQAATTASSITEKVTSVSTTFTVVKNTAVTSYAIDDFSTLYAADSDTYGTVTLGSPATRRYGYAGWATVYGKTSSGTRVLLPVKNANGDPVIAGVSTSNKDFSAYSDLDMESNNHTTKVMAFANGYTTTGQTSSTGTLSVAINSLDGTDVTTVSSSLASSSAEPVATSIGCYVNVHNSSVGDYNDVTGVATLAGTDIGSTPFLNIVDSKTATWANWGKLRFVAADQYTWNGSLVSIYIGTGSSLKKNGTAVTGTIGFNNKTGYVTVGGVDITDMSTYSGTLVLTAVSGSITKTITLNIESSTITFTSATDKTTANNIATLGITGTLISSSNTSVATADLSTNTGYVTIKSVAAGTATITVSDGTHIAKIPVTVSAKGAITIGTIVKYTTAFTAGQTASVANTNLELNMVGTDVSSSDETVATAEISSGNIVITSVAAGTATITVTDAATLKSATIAVTVEADGTVTIGTITKPADTTAPDAPTITSPLANATVGATPTVTGTAEAGSTVKLYQAGTLLGTATADSTTGAFSITSSTLTDGSYTLYVTATDSSSNVSASSATVAVTVDTTVAVTGVSLDKTTDTITAGGTDTLTATVAPTTATDSSVTWSSSDTGVATVSSTGVVTAVAAGTATITVTTTDGSYTATCTVTVS